MVEQHTPDEIKGNPQAREAVADAMLVAQKHMAAQIFENHTGDVDFSSLEKLAKLKKEYSELSANDCMINSARVVTHLKEKYPELFTHMLLLKSTVFPNGFYHSLFLAQDTEGMWYAGSPANYVPDSSYNRLTHIFSGELHRVLSGIKYEEWGSWPTDKEIETILQRNDKPEVQLESPEKGKILTIMLDRDHAFPIRFGFDFTSPQK